MTLAEKLDQAYLLGVIAVVSANGLIIPVRARADIRATADGKIFIHYADHWLPVRPQLIKFIRHH